MEICPAKYLCLPAHLVLKPSRISTVHEKRVWICTNCSAHIVEDDSFVDDLKIHLRLDLLARNVDERKFSAPLHGASLEVAIWSRETEQTDLYRSRPSND